MTGQALGLISHTKPGVSGALSGCESSNQTSSRFINTQNLSQKPATSAYNMSETLSASGSLGLSGSNVVTFTISNDTDVTSKLLLGAELNNTAVAGAMGNLDQWANFAGLALMKEVQIQVGSQVWETIDRPAMLATMQCECTPGEWSNWSHSMGGGTGRPAAGPLHVGFEYASNSNLNGSCTTNGNFFVGGMIPCFLKGSSQGSFINAAAPYQTVTIRISLGSQTDLVGLPPASPAMQGNSSIVNFRLYTASAIMADCERGLLPNHEFVQVTGQTQSFLFQAPTDMSSNKTWGASIDNFNHYTSYIAIIARKSGANIGSHLDCIETVELVYNNASAGVRLATLMQGSDQTPGLPMGGNAGDGVINGGVFNGEVSKVNVYKLAEFPKTVPAGSGMLSPMQGDGVNNGRFDNITVKFTLKSESTAAAGVNPTLLQGDMIDIIGFGNGGVLYSQGVASFFF